MMKGLCRLVEQGKKLWEAENWAAFKERYNFNESKDSGSQERIEIIDSRIGIPTVRVRSSTGKWAFFHSSVDPVQEARKIANSICHEAGKMVVVYGFALGYFIEALLEVVDERNPIFIIEPDLDLFYAAMGARDLRHIISCNHVYILLSDSANEVKNSFAKLYDPHKYNDIIMTGLPGHQIVYSDSYVKTSSYVKDVVNGKLLSLVTMIKMGSDFATNSLLNVVAYCTHPGIRSLFDRFSGMPAIIVSAGPSLNKNIQLLKEAKGRAAILAVGTAVKPLKKWGIEPDFIFSIDPHPLNYEHFKGVDVGDSALVAEIQSNHMVFENYQGPLFVSGNNVILKWFGDSIEKKGTTESGGSVAHNAMSAAYKMGANPIVFVGQDLAYSRDGHSHAAGTNYENKVYSEGESLDYFYVKANDGGQLLTDRSFYQFIAFFQLFIEKYSDREYINATEGGALIQGTKLMTLQEVLDKYCNKMLDVQRIIREVQSSFQVPSLEPVLKMMELREKDTKDTIAEARAAIKQLAKLEKACENRQAKKIQSHLKAVNKIYEKFENDQHIREVAEWFGQHDIHGVFSRTHAAEYAGEDDYHAAIADYSIYYEKVLEGSKVVEELLGCCIKRIRREIYND